MNEKRGADIAGIVGYISRAGQATDAAQDRRNKIDSEGIKHLALATQTKAEAYNKKVIGESLARFNDYQSLYQQALTDAKNQDTDINREAREEEALSKKNKALLQNQIFAHLQTKKWNDMSPAELTANTQLIQLANAFSTESATQKSGLPGLQIDNEVQKLTAERDRNAFLAQKSRYDLISLRELESNKEYTIYDDDGNPYKKSMTGIQYYRWLEDATAGAKFNELLGKIRNDNAVRDQMYTNMSLTGSIQNLNEEKLQMDRLLRNLKTDQLTTLKQKNANDLSILTSIGLIRNNILNKLEDPDGYSDAELDEDLQLLSDFQSTNTGSYGTSAFQFMKKSLSDVERIDEKLLSLKRKSNKTPQDLETIASLERDRILEVNASMTQLSVLDQNARSSFNKRLSYVQFLGYAQDKRDSFPQDSDSWKFYDEMLRTPMDDFIQEGERFSSSSSSRPRLWDQRSGLLTRSARNAVMKVSHFGDDYVNIGTLERPTMIYQPRSPKNIVSRLSSGGSRFNIGDSVHMHIQGQLAQQANTQTGNGRKPQDLSKELIKSMYDGIDQDYLSKIEEHYTGGETSLLEKKNAKRVIPLYGTIKKLIDNSELALFTNRSGTSFIETAISHIISDLGFNTSDDAHRKQVWDMIKHAKSISENSLRNIPPEHIPDYKGTSLIINGEINEEFIEDFKTFRTGSDMNNLDPLWKDSLSGVFTELAGNRKSFNTFKHYLAWDGIAETLSSGQKSELPVGLVGLLQSYNLSNPIVSERVNNLEQYPSAKDQAALVTKLWQEYEEENVPERTRKEAKAKLLNHYEDQVLDKKYPEIRESLGLRGRKGKLKKLSGKSLEDLLASDTEAISLFDTAVQSLLKDEELILGRLGQAAADRIARIKKENDSGIIYQGKWYLPTDDSAYEMSLQEGRWRNKNKVVLPFIDSMSGDSKEFKFGIGQLDMGVWGIDYGK